MSDSSSSLLGNSPSAENDSASSASSSTERVILRLRFPGLTSAPISGHAFREKDDLADVEPELRGNDSQMSCDFDSWVLPSGSFTSIISGEEWAMNARERLSYMASRNMMFVYFTQSRNMEGER